MTTEYHRDQPRSTPQTFTGNELRDKVFAPITWAVPDILPAGVTLFGGREKMGKSWLAFSLCIAVATGGYALGKMPVERGGALYLSLEDPERRLHRRIRRLTQADTDLGRLHYAFEWEPADRGGVEDLNAWLDEHPDTRLVVVDTLKRIRPRTSGRRNLYDEDYEALQPFVKLAATHNAAIVVVHHLNQLAEPQDPFDAFSGSSGLTAAAEHIWLLTRKRGDADAYLLVDGKDIEERQELALGWDGATTTWTVQGDAATHRLNKERREIVELLEREGEPMGPKEVADTLGRDYEATKRMMARMADNGELKRAGYGKYIPPQGPGPTSPTGLPSTNGLRGTRGTRGTPPLHESTNNSHRDTDKRHSQGMPDVGAQKAAGDEKGSDVGETSTPTTPPASGLTEQQLRPAGEASPHEKDFMSSPASGRRPHPVGTSGEPENDAWPLGPDDPIQHEWQAFALARDFDFEKYRRAQRSAS